MRTDLKKDWTIGDPAFYPLLREGAGQGWLLHEMEWAIESLLARYRKDPSLFS